ncbi:uncharacterized protein LOC131675612 [Phymastichus coffea]|uniref:uncharacterized protein LOC131675612 n=1 Tax=Phymastichus coffea TaxID=108790 RepID=UPI00273AEA22|nr:uncharacterized protein LOC131675612 [Phymastichus coffea]
MNFDLYRERLFSVQRRGALRTSSAYWTVSREAILGVDGVIPVDLLARERKRIYDRRLNENKVEVAKEESDRTIEVWRERWSRDGKGVWTRSLIPDIGAWMERSFGEVNFYLTQMLTCYGYFKCYRDSPNSKVENRVLDRRIRLLFTTA